MASRAIGRAVGALAAAALLVPSAHAQDTTRTSADSARRAAADSTRKPVACDGQRIDYIAVNSSAPSIAIFRRVPVLAEIARSIHITTKPDLIRRFLLLEEGRPCTELRRTESERILRAQPYIADASVLAFANDRGGVNIEVRTSDEVSVIAGVSVSSGSPYLTALRGGNSNLNGLGIYAGANWRHNDVFRNGYGFRFADYQLFGRPYIFATQLQRDPLGDRWNVESAHPFLTDLQRIAWGAHTGRSNEYAYFEPTGAGNHAVLRNRHYFDVGGLVRLGPPGRLSLFGASLSGEREVSADSAVLVTPTGLLPDTSSIFFNRYPPHRFARINALWGVRDIDFVSVEGFDGLTARQDIPVGFQLGTLFGRSLSVLGATDDDIFMSADLYVGAANRRAALRVQLQGEGRRANDQDVWDSILTGGRIAQYLKLSSAQVAVLAAEWSGGWRVQTPFVLTLGEEPGGVRGFGSSTTPGGQRAILRFEDRVFVGRPFGLADAGVGFFADAGRLWAGDVPYGTSTPVRASLGLSVLGAVPPRSARLWRLDVAFPLNPEGRGTVEFRIVSVDRSTFFWREPRDLRFSREQSVPSSIFNWP